MSSGDLIERLQARRVEHRGYELDNNRTIPSKIGRGQYCKIVPDPDCLEAAATISRLREELAEAIEVMRPFAKDAGLYAPDEQDGRILDDEHLAEVDLGWLRRAAVFIAKHTGEK